MRIAFFEDSATSNFNPLALTRPVFELICGQFSFRERILRRFDVFEWGAFLRPELAETYREEFPEAKINDETWLQSAKTLLVNGRWLPTLEALAEVREEDCGVIDGVVAWLWLDPMEATLLADDPWDKALSQIAATRQRVEAGGSLIQFPWDLVDNNARQLRDDFRLRRFGGTPANLHPQITLLGATSDIYIDPTATIDPFVVIDARKGPVSIDARAIIKSFTQLEGPCHVGREAQLFRAQIHEATTIGPHCRVGGEVEASILHAYVNKHHTGFLGHSYLCPWVNLGAMTTNSDLKNDYSHVRVPIAGNSVESGSRKVGCYIGDHAKTAIGTLLNTGTTLGVMSMVLPTGELPPKHIPSFARVWRGRLSEGTNVEDALKTARIVTSRRNIEFTRAQERLIQNLFAATQDERDKAIQRFDEKRHGIVATDKSHISANADLTS